MRTEEVTNGGVDPCAFCVDEPTMATIWHGDEFVGYPSLLERLVQAYAVGVGDYRISITMNGEDRRKSLPHIRERRYTFRHLLQIVRAAAAMLR